MIQPSQNRAARLSRQSLVADPLGLARTFGTFFRVPNLRGNALPHQSRGQSPWDRIPWTPRQGLADIVSWLLQLIQHSGLQLRQYVIRCRRPMATGGMVLLILCAAGLGILGIYALHTAPLLAVDAGFTFILSASDLRRIEDLSLEPTFVHRLPEFFTPAPEANWWQIQEGVYTVLKGRESVDVEVTGTLYLITSAPVASRALTLHPLSFNLLTASPLSCMLPRVG